MEEQEVDAPLSEQQGAEERIIEEAAGILAREMGASVSDTETDRILFLDGMYAAKTLHTASHHVYAVLYNLSAAAGKCDVSVQVLDDATRSESRTTFRDVGADGEAVAAKIKKYWQFCAD